MKKLTILNTAFLALWLVGCRQQDDKGLVTERIQYDVNIKSPDPEWDWWKENLEGAKREALVRGILQAAYEGRVQCYDVSHKALTPDEVKAIGNRTDTITGTSPHPPYNDTVMVLKEELDLLKINRVRFLEEWRMNASTLEFDKEVLGIAPVIESYDEAGNLRGWMPLFWVYFDKAYPGKFDVR